MGTLNVKMNTGYQYGDAILDIRNELGCAEFDPTVIYNEGDKVLYKGTRYSRKSWGADTPAAESWDASHWTALDPVFDLLDGKVNTQQSVLDAGKALGIGQDGKVVPVPFSGEDFTGATSSTAGTHGYVPAPAAGDQGKVLMGGGNWSSDIPDRIAELENVCTEQDVTIQTSDWTLSNGTYTYEWSNSLVTSSCAIEVTTRDGAENSGIEYFDAVKSVGSITFTTTDTPTGSFPVRVTIVNAKADAFQSLSADEISSEAISDCDNVEEALTNLDGRLGNVPSGETAQGQIDTLNSNLATKLTNTLGSPVAIGTTNYTTLADGYFVITLAASLNRHVTGFVNDAEIMSITGKDYNTGYPHTSLFVRKGMKIRVSESVSGESGANFYPFV